jgi:ParB-like chromosome segregation protein Spo0J
MKLQIDYIPTSEIIPYSNNPRKNDKAVDFVAKSIKEYGFKNPIILDKENQIIAGHTRLKAAEKLGLKELDFDLELTGKKAINLNNSKK